MAVHPDDLSRWPSAKSLRCLQVSSRSYFGMLAASSKAHCVGVSYEASNSSFAAGGCYGEDPHDLVWDMGLDQISALPTVDSLLAAVRAMEWAIDWDLSAEIIAELRMVEAAIKAGEVPGARLSEREVGPDSHEVVWAVQEAHRKIEAFNEPKAPPINHGRRKDDAKS